MALAILVALVYLWVGSVIGRDERERADESVSLQENMRMREQGKRKEREGERDALWEHVSGCCVTTLGNST